MRTDSEWRSKRRVEALPSVAPVPHGVDKQDYSREVLSTADSTIHTDRHAEYGTAEESFGRIANLWEDYLGIPIDAHDVAMLMVLLKVSRAKTDKKLDTAVDICGYAALGYRVSQ